MIVKQAPPCGKFCTDIVAFIRYAALVEEVATRLYNRKQEIFEDDKENNHTGSIKATEAAF